MTGSTKLSGPDTTGQTDPELTRIPFAIIAAVATDTQISRSDQ
jgi:hypothetical protein